MKHTIIYDTAIIFKRYVNHPSGIIIKLLWFSMSFAFYVRYRNSHETPSDVSCARRITVCPHRTDACILLAHAEVKWL